MACFYVMIKVWKSDGKDALTTGRDRNCVFGFCRGSQNYQELLFASLCLSVPLYVRLQSLVVAVPCNCAVEMNSSDVASYQVSLKYVNRFRFWTHTHTHT